MAPTGAKDFARRKGARRWTLESRAKTFDSKVKHRFEPELSRQDLYPVPHRWPPLCPHVLCTSDGRLRYAKREVSTVLNLHALRVKLLQEVAVLYWRLYCVIRSSPLADTPTSVRPLLAGTVAELHIEKVFPCTKCFVLCELETFAIRWTPFHFVSLYTVDNVQKRHTGIETSAPKRHRSTLPGADRCSSFCQLSGASSQRPSGATAEEPPLQCQANVGAAAATPCDSASQPDRKSHRGSRRNSKDSAAVKKTFDILITFRDGGGYTR
eukprot:1945062-Prymnesium_polylepis.1